MLPTANALLLLPPLSFLLLLPSPSLAVVNYILDRDNATEECCPVIHLSSSGPAAAFQPDRLGAYVELPGRRVNGRKVYAHYEGDDYLYYWRFEDGDGENWLVSNDYGQHRHGIESPDMTGDERCVDGKCVGTCIEDINLDGYPFSAWTRLHRLGGFHRDTTLRVECWDINKANSCCDRVRVRSLGVGGDLQSERMGVYAFSGYRHGRKIYRQEDAADPDRAQYLYYYDWGPNSGSNWMIGFDPARSGRGVESVNVENRTNVCVTDAHRADDGVFKVWERSTRSWRPDPLLRVECYDAGVACCDKVQVSSDGGPAEHYRPQMLGVYDFWRAKNGRSCYKHEEREFYLHFNDWGVQAGSNWMISSRSDASQGEIVSQNLEFSAESSSTGGMSRCATDAVEAGPFLVYHERHGWLEDHKLRVGCVLMEDRYNKRIRKYKNF